MNEGVQLLTSRKCLCLLSRLPLMEMHEAVLERCVRDRAQHVACRMAQMLASSGHGDLGRRRHVVVNASHVVVNSFGVQDWWGLGNAPSTFARALLRSYRNLCIPSPDEPLPSFVCVKGIDIPLLPRHAAVAAAAGGGRGRQPRCSADEEVDQYLHAITVLLCYLSLETIISVVSALLLERRVVVECSDPLILSAIAMALPQARSMCVCVCVCVCVSVCIYVYCVRIFMYMLCVCVCLSVCVCVCMQTP